MAGFGFFVRNQLILFPLEYECFIFILTRIFSILGCMWCIAGLHDQGWNERSVFGTVRYMSYIGCKKKFNTAEFIAKYGGKVYPYEKIHE